MRCLAVRIERVLLLAESRYLFADLDELTIRPVRDDQS
jgi:hypothetical protein